MKAGDPIITQGDDGDHLYIVDSGRFDCFVKKGDAAPPGIKVLSYGPSESFGELALMYNTPRAASVIAVEDSVLWAMERLCFRTILMQSMVQKRQRYEAIVSSISLLKTLDSNTRAIIEAAYNATVRPTYACMHIHACHCPASRPGGPCARRV